MPERSHKQDEKQSPQTGRDLPEGPEPVEEGPNWQERYVEKNADKYGQAGGQPIAQRGPGQSTGGDEHKDAGAAPTRDAGSRSAPGIREIKRRPAPQGQDEAKPEP